MKISLKSLILCTLILAQVFAITEYDYYSSSTTAQKARCMDVKSTQRNGAAAAADNCTVCRPDKDSKGEIKIDTTATTPLGTYGVKPTNRDSLTSNFDCLTKINDDGTKENQYDQELKIPYCELYDNHGLCARCMVNYGLQWKATSSTDGAYRCIENRNRTPYCHKYNTAGVCTECKWNQDAEQKDVYVDHAYKLDFGLFNSLCVSNLQIDYQLDTFSATNKLTKDQIVSNCSEYNSDRKCIRCHTRQFDLEGEIPNNGSTPNYRSKLDFVLRVKGKDDAKPLCVAHSDAYVTHPKLLVQMNDTNANDTDNNLYFDKSNDTNKAKTNDQCASGFELWKHKNDNVYGCVESSSVTGCSKIELDWDRDEFQKSGVWYKKFSKCIECTNGDTGTRYFLNQDTNKCLTGFNDDADPKKCIAYKGTDCMLCKDSYNIVLQEVRTTANNVNTYSFKNVCSNATINPTANSNCKTTKKAQVYDSDTATTFKDYEQCIECKEGYTLQETDVFSNRLTCKSNDNSFTRGCKLLDKSGITCKTTGAWGYSTTGFCNTRRFNALACILTTGKTTIENCQTYYHTYDSSTCIECKAGFTLIMGGGQCQKVQTTDTYVENCELLDGTWCQKCKSGYVVQQYNVCIKAATGATGIDSNCIQVEVDTNEEQTCKQCAYGYTIQNSSCQQWSNLVTPAAGKVRIMTLDNYKAVTPKWIDGVNVEGCRFYSDDQGHCYVCQSKDNKLYGVSVDATTKAHTCTVCPDDTKDLKETDDVQNTLKILTCSNAVTQNVNHELGTKNFCEHGYAPKSGAADTDPTTCTLIINYGCIRYDNNGVCIACEWPYLLNSNQCLIQQPNCLAQSSTACTTCLPGYQLSGGKCYKKPDRCAEMNWEKSWNGITSFIQTQVCSKCLYDEQDKNGLRLFINGANMLEYGCLGGCQSRVRSMRTRIDANPHNVWTCTQCRNDKFHFNQNIKWCVEATNIDNCVNYTNDIARFDETCETCKSGFYLISTKKTCSTCTLPDNCTTSDGKSTITVSSVTKCRCTICASTPTKYYLQADGTCKTSNVSNCQTYNDSGVCTACTSGNYLTNGTCVQYSTDLNCLTFNPTADQCLTCNKSENYLNSAFKCIVQSTFQNCKYFSQTDVKGETCDECKDGYGLRVDYKECISNTWEVTATVKKYGQSKCFRYATLIDSDGYWHCITCYEGYAFDYSFSKFKENKGQCVKTSNCSKGKYNTGATQDVDQQCYTCKIRDVNNNLVYRKQTDSTSEVGTCVSTGDTAASVKRCKNFIGTKCSQCHFSFQPDYDTNGNGGNICVSEDHPGALPGCSQYDVVIDTTVNTINWSKYEFLRCSKCYKSWIFHSYMTNTSTSLLYSLNTYNRQCDTVTADVSFSLPQVNKWEGKDGGVIDITDDNDKEEYEDPVLSSAKLSFSLILLLALIFAL